MSDAMTDTATHFARKSGALSAELMNVRTTLKVALDMHRPEGRLSAMLTELLGNVNDTLARTEAMTCK